MTLSLIYRGFEVVDRPGIGQAIIIRAGVEENDLRALLKGDYGFLFLLNGYDITLYSVRREGVRPSTFSPIFSISKLRGYGKLSQAPSSLEVEFEIPVSAKLINCINEVRRKAELLGLAITCSLSFVKLPYYGSDDIKSTPGQVAKILPDGEKFFPMVFFIEEIDELMKRLGYAEVMRFEVPIPLIPEVPIEYIKRSVVELKNAEEKITKGDYPEALNILRNVMMNYLTKKVDNRRVLKEELREQVMENIPSDLRSIYEKILEGIENTLVSNLDHVHKFIKEDTGKLIAMPSREEAEYVYLTLIAILRYLSQLTITWGKSFHT